MNARQELGELDDQLFHWRNKAQAALNKCRKQAARIAELEEIESKYVKLERAYRSWSAQMHAHMDLIDELKSLGDELADVVEMWVRNHYDPSGNGVHPALLWKYERDLEEVELWKALRAKSMQQ